MTSFRDIWNHVISRPDSRPFSARDYIYASEVGGSIYDVWHKMKGFEPTTPPNDRSYRKFNAGNFWEEYVKLVLISAGCLHSEQIQVNTERDGDKLGVHGRLDFIAQPGEPIVIDALPDFFKKYVNEFNGLFAEKTVLEIKSVSSMLFPKREIEPAENHKAQLYHYTSNLGLPGQIVYISKDDCLMAEHEAKDEWKVEYLLWVSLLSGFYLADEKPPLEPLILFEKGKFAKNWKVEYSGYLDHYGFESPDQYRDQVSCTVSRWNRVIKRIEEGKNMTDDNKRAIQEWETKGFQI